MAYLYLACAFLLNAAANVLLKIGSQRGLLYENMSPFAIISGNWQLLLGLVLFATNVLFYFLALRVLPISIAYPAMVIMSFILINSYALLFLGEHIGPAQILGYVLVTAGLICIVGFAR